MQTRESQKVTYILSISYLINNRRNHAWKINDTILLNQST